MTIQSTYSSRVTAGDLHHDPVQEEVLPELERIRAGLVEPVKKGFFRKAPDPIKGLYLWGGVGRGKSMLMDLLCADVTVPKRREHFHAFMQWVHSEMKKARDRGVDDAIKPVADSLSSDIRFLAFDEMQITDITDAMIVGRLFEALFEAGVTIVTTSNRPPDDLYKDGLNRQLFLPFIDQLNTRLNVWELSSETDYRQRKLAGEEVYFSPVNREARGNMDRIWQELTAGDVAPLILKVKGREVEIREYHNGVARCAFFDLCGRMLGAADYLELAKAARVLLLDDIPRLSRSNFNEAKRFVTLIDALYEGGVKLICSAAAIPEMLYVEGEGTFEFERTASRLREMQGQDWGREA